MPLFLGHLCVEKLLFDLVKFLRVLVAVNLLVSQLLLLVYFLLLFYLLEHEVAPKRDLLHSAQPVDLLLRQRFHFGRVGHLADQHPLHAFRLIGL